MTVYALRVVSANFQESQFLKRRQKGSQGAEVAAPETLDCQRRSDDGQKKHYVSPGFFHHLGPTRGKMHPGDPGIVIPPYQSSHLPGEADDEYQDEVLEIAQRAVDCRRQFALGDFQQAADFGGTLSDGSQRADPAAEDPSHQESDEDHSAEKNQGTRSYSAEPCSGLEIDVEAFETSKRTEGIHRWRSRGAPSQQLMLIAHPGNENKKTDLYRSSKPF